MVEGWDAPLRSNPKLRILKGHPHCPNLAVHWAACSSWRACCLEHQLAPLLGVRAPTRASSASVGPLLGVRTRQGEHHQHQLAPVLGVRAPTRASSASVGPLAGREGPDQGIISISWPLAGRENPTTRASSASVGPRAGREGPDQGIISISWPPCWA